MTVSTTHARSGPYAGDGITTTFTVTFQFFDPEDLRVIERENESGAETEKLLGSDYTVGGGNGATGTVLAIIPPAPSVSWTILRATPLTQDIDYVENDPFPASSHEEGLDRATMRLQDLQAVLQRTPGFPASDPESGFGSLPNALQRAGKVLAYDSSGKPVASTLSLAMIEQGAMELAESAASASASAAQAALSASSSSASAVEAAASAAQIALPEPEAHAGRRIVSDGVGWALDEGAGTAAHQLVQLDGLARLPAVDGSQLTNLPVAAGLGNRIINGDFRINQRGYASAAALSAGAYGHDRWKAGASGGDYSFTQLSSSTEITIASGKSLIQVIEAANIEGGTYVLSWEGTAEARAGVDSDTPSGSYAASPLVINGQTAGTVMSVEFNEGTLGKVQLEPGETVSDFEARPIGIEIALCQRYFAKSYPIGVAPGTTSQTAGGIGVNTSTTGNGQGTVTFIFPQEMRATPTVTIYSPNSGTAGNAWAIGGSDQAVNAAQPNTRGAYASLTGAGGAGWQYLYHYAADAEL